MNACVASASRSERCPRPDREHVHASESRSAPTPAHVPPPQQGVRVCPSPHGARARCALPSLLSAQPRPACPTEWPTCHRREVAGARGPRDSNAVTWQRGQRGQRGQRRRRVWRPPMRRRRRPPHRRAKQQCWWELPRQRRPPRRAGWRGFLRRSWARRAARPAALGGRRVT